jgi:hypothetical protein
MKTSSLFVMDRLVRVCVTVAMILGATGLPFVPVNAFAQSVTTTAPAALAALPSFDSPLPVPTTSGAISTPEPSASGASDSSTAMPPVALSMALTPTMRLVDRAGGRLASADNRVQLDVPPGLFEDSTQLSITPRPVSRASDPDWMMAQFDLSALDATTGQALSVFSQTITLTVDLRGVATWANTPPGTQLVIATNISGTWVPVPDVTMPEYGLMVVPLRHFSQWATGYMAKQWKITYNAPVVSTFSGAGTFNYPIEVPPGRNGFAPQINLSYNSRRAWVGQSIRSTWYGKMCIHLATQPITGLATTSR